MPPPSGVRRVQEEPIAYQQPGTKYYRKIAKTRTLEDYAVYAEAERRNRELGTLLSRHLTVPLLGKYFYSPGGAAIVERAREALGSDEATAKWFRAFIASPGTAVLG